MKNTLSTFLLLYCLLNISIAQQVSLKNPLSESDRIYLQKQARDCFGYNAGVSFSFQTGDFYDSKHITPAKPSSMAQVKKHEKALKGNYRDASIYNNMGLEYKGLFKKEEASKNFNKALELAKEWVKAEPDSSAAHSILAAVYFDLENFHEAALAFQKAHELDSKDSLSQCMIPLSFIFAGEFDMALPFIEKEIKTQPDSSYSYTTLIFFSYYKMYMGLRRPDGTLNTEQLKNKFPSEMIDLKIIEDAYKNHKDNIQFELLYRFTRHLSVCMKSLLITFNDTSTSFKNIKFILEEKDISELNDLEKFYHTCLNDPRIPNKFIAYKSLGNIHLLKGEARRAIPFLEKAIQLKPLNKSNFQNNAAEDYDNLAGAHFILNDTTLFEKTVIRKFKIRPGINPIPADYIQMSRISFYHKDYEQAKKYALEALQMDENMFESYICFAAIDAVNNNTKDAFIHMEKANKINSGIFSVYVLQGICLLYEGDASTAYYSFQKAKEFINNPRWIDDELINKFLF